MSSIKINTDRLEEIKETILDLLIEAEDIVRRGDRMTYQRAKSYWLPHIETAIQKEHGYLGGSIFTMEDTIKALKEENEANGHGSED